MSYLHVFIYILVFSKEWLSHRVGMKNKFTFTRRKSGYKNWSFEWWNRALSHIHKVFASIWNKICLMRMQSLVCCQQNNCHHLISLWWHLSQFLDDMATKQTSEKTLWFRINAIEFLSILFSTLHTYYNEIYRFIH